MLDFSDPENLEELLERLKKVKKVLELTLMIDEVYPDWFVTMIDDFSEDYETLKSDWYEISYKTGQKPFQIMIVEDLPKWSDNYKLINIFANYLTHIGFAIYSKSELYTCLVCGKAIASPMFWNNLKKKGKEVPEKWLAKCSNC